jgi:hypothetical protein
LMVAGPEPRLLVNVCFASRTPIQFLPLLLHRRAGASAFGVVDGLQALWECTTDVIDHRSLHAFQPHSECLPVRGCCDTRCRHAVRF